MRTQARGIALCGLIADNNDYDTNGARYFTGPSTRILLGRCSARS